MELVFQILKLAILIVGLAGAAVRLVLSLMGYAREREKDRRL